MGLGEAPLECRKEEEVGEEEEEEKEEKEEHTRLLRGAHDVTMFVTYVPAVCSSFMSVRVVPGYFVFVRFETHDGHCGGQ